MISEKQELENYINNVQNEVCSNQEELENLKNEKEVLEYYSENILNEIYEN